MTDEELARPGFEEMEAVFREYLSPEDAVKVIGLCQELADYGADQKKLRERFMGYVMTENSRELLLAMLGQIVTCQHDDEVEII